MGSCRSLISKTIVINQNPVYGFQLLVQATFEQLATCDCVMLATVVLCHEPGKVFFVLSGGKYGEVYSSIRSVVLFF